MSVSLRTMFLAATLAAFATAGCADLPGDGSAAVSIAPVTEQWTLSHVDAWRPPMSIEAGAGVSRQILGGSLLFSAEGAWTFTVSHHDTGVDVDRAAALTLTGHYTRDGGTVRLVEDTAGAEYAATLNDDGTLDLPFGGHRYRFTVTQ